jgi:hypothetical protein
MTELKLINTNKHRQSQRCNDLFRNFYQRIHTTHQGTEQQQQNNMQQ